MVSLCGRSRLLETEGWRTFCPSLGTVYYQVQILMGGGVAKSATNTLTIQLVPTRFINHSEIYILRSVSPHLSLDRLIYAHHQFFLTSSPYT